MQIIGKTSASVSMTSTNRSPRFFPIFLHRSSDAAGSQYLDSFTASNLPLERLMSSVMFTVVGDRYLSISLIRIASNLSKAALVER